MNLSYQVNKNKMRENVMKVLQNSKSLNASHSFPDGVLWDVRSGKEIHKFDKLNQAISGVFHPNGLEVPILFIHTDKKLNLFH